jgi:hypothetical protein
VGLDFQKIKRQKLSNKAALLDEAISYVKHLREQVQV